MQPAQLLFLPVVTTSPATYLLWNARGSAARCVPVEAPTHGARGSVDGRAALVFSTSEGNSVGSVAQFEIYSEEADRLAGFYRSLLGWKLEKAPGVDYWWVQTEPTNTTVLNGALTELPLPGPRSWVHYVNVEVGDETMGQVQLPGEEMLRPKTGMPRTAWYALVEDPEGNISAIWQPDSTAFPSPGPD